MRKIVILNILTYWLLGVAAHVQAQSPLWTVNADQYQHSMTIVCQLSFNEQITTDDADKVAAFVNGECRGMAAIRLMPATQKHLAYLIVYSNSENDTIHFKLYDASTDSVFTPRSSIVFKSDYNYGTADQPVVLNTKAIEFTNPLVNAVATLAGPTKLFTVWPTITSGDVFISPCSGTQAFALQVLDCTGRCILRSTSNTASSINLSSTTPGLYLIRLTQGLQSQTVRVLKE